MMCDQRERTEVNGLEGPKRPRLSHAGRRGDGVRVWMLRFVVQKVEKFRMMTKPGCDGGE